MIPALVLTAGLATRLRPLSFERAKGALPVAGRSIARRILETLAGASVTDVVLNLHHLPQTLTADLGDGSHLGVRVRYSWETPVLGSAGGPRRALPLVDSDDFLIVNGDTLTDVDLAALVADHERSGALVTLAVVPNVEPGKYNGLAAGDDGAWTGRIVRGTSEPSFHFVGVQVARAEAFATVPPHVPCESIATLYPELVAARPGSVRLFPCQAEFHDIGTPADYLDTCLRLAARERVDLLTVVDATVGTDAVVERSVLWDRVVVEPGARVKECVVTDDVVVPSDTSWHGVTIRVARGPLAPGEQQVGALAVKNL